jgi:general secretion pathway protein J
MLVNNMQKYKGFTLLEILIALFIFSIISLILAAALRSVINAAEGTERNAEKLHALQTTFLLLSRDVEQALNRPVRNKISHETPAWLGEEQSMTFTRGGVVSLGGEMRSGLQRVAYTYSDGQLSRLTWARVDAEAQPSQSKVLLSHLLKVEFLYVDKALHIQKAWPSKDGGDNPEALPIAVIINLACKDWGKISQLYLVGAHHAS